jgi:hypothetical protein
MTANRIHRRTRGYSADKQLARAAAALDGSGRAGEGVFVVTEAAWNNEEMPQRAIYDERYSAGLYDRRPAVRVLTAERHALSAMIARAVTANPRARRISVFDFGYGTGRVINDWVRGHADQQLTHCEELRIVAYDVSSVGLRVAADRLREAGFESVGPQAWDPDATEGYIAGTFHKREADLRITMVFAHGCESQPPEVMRELALTANDGDQYLLATSWYSGLGHVPGDNLRREYFRSLSELTSPSGEMILCLSATGDLVEVQPEWARRREAGDTGGYPIERPGDLVYHTELGQPNFYHVFGAELNDYMASITSAGQHWWVEGIRYPDPEFESREAEQDNYRRVRQANQSKRGRAWSAHDYQEFHTVAAFRSMVGPGRDGPVGPRAYRGEADPRRPR